MSEVDNRFYRTPAGVTFSEETVVMFLGFMSADLPELHEVECWKMLESWGRFKMSKAALAPKEAT